MQFTIYRNPGRSTLYPLLIDVTSDIIGALNTRIVIPLLPVERYPNPEVRPARLNPVLELIDGKQYALMTHELASIPLKALLRAQSLIHRKRARNLRRSIGHLARGWLQNSAEMLNDRKG